MNDVNPQQLPPNLGMLGTIRVALQLTLVIGGTGGTGGTFTGRLVEAIARPFARQR